ncbi:MAG TPA: hypothetical protein VJ692_13435 [Nitrospiraceae bacterium]|nr:hypothetical protein [Nitrospiraceae bacterium]
MAVVALSGCAPAKVTTTASPAAEQRRVQTIVVMPFGKIQTPQILDKPLTPEFSVPRGAVRSQIYVPVAPPSPDKLNLTTTRVPASVPERVTHIFYERLRQRGGLRILSPDEATRALKGVEADTAESRERTAEEVARRLGADAAVVGRVLVYKEREGSKIAANSAAVGFEVKLIAADGTTLWVGNYYEKQRPLIEDVTGFFQRGGVFVTADELAKYGADHLVRKFPFGQPEP